MEFYKSYDDLKRLVKKTKKLDLKSIDRAFDFASKTHKNQKRLSGIDYIYHSVSVACILIELGMDTNTIVAALLHDTVEDTDATFEDIKKNFGNKVSLIVFGVTKLGKIPLSTKEERQAENLRKMLLAISKDIRVIIIKLADRLHNMRTIECMSYDHRCYKSLETMEIYAPLAHRLGMMKIKEELENISIKILDPTGCKEIEKALEIKKESKDLIIKHMKERIIKRFSEVIPNANIGGRIKSLWGIYRKVFAFNHNIEEIYDIFAIRIIVSTVSECYNALGIIHDMFRSIPNRFKDYISTPKFNFYQSLHTTVIGNNTVPFEIQIRTWDMHYTSEYGIAAHWKYKLETDPSKKTFDERLSWLRHLLENQTENHDAGDFLGDIKMDLASEEIYVFTPKGDVINLPVGSCVIDFAYSIHTEVGHKMISAKIDKRTVPIAARIKNGQIIEIVISKDFKRGPSRDWIKIVRTSEARNKIRNYFKRKSKKENILAGKKEVENEIINKMHIPQNEIIPFLKIICKSQKCENLEKFYEVIGFGGIIIKKIMPKIKEKYSKFKKINSNVFSKEVILKSKQNKFNKTKQGADVTVDGIESFVTNLAKCCNPLPGDEICAFITKSCSASVHKKTCLNSPKNKTAEENEDRWVDACWKKNNSKSSEFKSRIEVVSKDREGLLADITLKLSLMNIFIKSVSTRSLSDGICVMNIVIMVKNLEHLKEIILSVKRIRDILSATRL